MLLQSEQFQLISFIGSGRVCSFFTHKTVSLGREDIVDVARELWIGMESAIWRWIGNKLPKKRDSKSIRNNIYWKNSLASAFCCAISWVPALQHHRVKVHLHLIGSTTFLPDQIPCSIFQICVGIWCRWEKTNVIGKQNWLSHVDRITIAFPLTLQCSFLQ